MRALLGSVRVVVRRARGDWSVLAAAVVTVLLAAALLAAGPIYASAVTLSGLHRTLQDAPTAQVDVQLTADVPEGQDAAVDERVTADVGATFAPIGATILHSARSESFALPDQPDGQPAGAVTELTVFATAEQVTAHATLQDGSWPQAADEGGAVPVALPTSAAARLHVAPGDRFVVTSRRSADLSVAVVVVGTYRVDNPSDPYWWGDVLDTTGAEQSGTFTTVGPLLTTEAGFARTRGGLSARLAWRVFPEVAQLTTDEVPALAAAVSSLRTSMAAGSPPVAMTTSLDELLTATERSLLVTRAGVLVVTVQLALLAGYLLLLTAGTLVERRRVETGLLHSRGAGTAQIVRTAAVEAVALALPAALLGPVVAAWSLRLLDRYGPLAAAGMSLSPVITPAAYLLSALAAVAACLALIVPMLQEARSFVQERAARARPAARGLAQRAGVDLLLVLVAVLGFWQLARYRGTLTASVQGRLGIDPFLVAAPALGLVAGAILALRLVPLLAGVLDRGAARRRGLVPALAAWQVSRRPSRYARSALLLVLAVAIGIFALSYGATWDRSQGDQADHQIGADVRVTPDLRTGTAIPAIDLPDAQSRIGGVIDSVGVHRGRVGLSTTAGSGDLLALDAAHAGQVVLLRPDLSADPLPTLMDRLTAGRPAPGPGRLPGTPRSLVLDLRLDTASTTPLDASAAVVLQDGDGLLHRLAVGALPADGAAVRRVVPLAFVASTGEVVVPRYPLRLVRVELTTAVPTDGSVTAVLRLTDLQVSGSVDGADPVEAGLDWSAYSWQVTRAGQYQPPSADALPTAGRGFAATLATGSGEPGQVAGFAYSSVPPQVDAALPVLANPAFLAATQAAPGDTVQVDVAGKRRPVTVVGVVDGFPTTTPDVPTLVVDLPTFAMLSLQADGSVPEPDEWWVSTEPGTSASVAAAMAAAPLSSPEVVTRDERAAALRADPVALGVLGALSLGSVAAGLLAALGFALSAAASARERRTEFALLRALGLTSPALTRWLCWENGLLLAFGLLAGTVIGLTLAAVVLPLVSTTQSAATGFPPTQVVVPWAPVLLLEAVLTVALGLVVLVLAARLRRIGISPALRVGEE